MMESAGSHVLMLLENDHYPQDSRVRNEASTLVSAGYQVSVICPKSSGQRWRESVNGVRVYRYPAPPAGSGFLTYLWEYGYCLVMSFVLSIVVALRRKIDIIHTHNPPDIFVLIAMFYKVLGARVVFDHHDLAPEMYYARFGNKGHRLVYRALVFFERLSCRVADHVIATNQSYKAVQMERHGVPEERITIVRNGPDLDRLQRVDPDPDLSQNAVTIIGYVGTMGFQDGIDYFLRAVRHLVYDLRRTDVFCVLVGKGDAWQSLRAYATELEIDKYVWFTGRISDEDLLRYLSAADICVDPDPSNPFNDRSTMIKMMEYMALGKPIVAFDLPEHRVTAQDAAVYARPNDELDFATKIAWLMDHPEERRERGSKGRKRVETTLAWPHQVNDLLEVYRSLDEQLARKRSVFMRRRSP
jgi:glycosyltransferase involved in cell wall biosynthesis